MKDAHLTGDSTRPRKPVDELRRARRGTTAQASTSTLPSKSSSSTDALASEFSTRLTIVAEEKAPRQLDERAIANNALQTLRKLSQTLSDAVQLGWRATTPTKPYTLKSLRSQVVDADVHVQTLRASAHSRPIDLERTVIHMAGRLVSLELVSDSGWTKPVWIWLISFTQVEDAQHMLIGSRQTLLSSYTHSASPLTRRELSEASGIDLNWNLPLPESTYELDESIAATLGASFVHSVQIMLRNCHVTTLEVRPISIGRMSLR